MKRGMTEPNAFLVNLAIVLGVAAVTTVLFHRLRLPVIFGYMLAGLVVGPHLPIPLVADRHVVDALAELGVVLLMFSLGLEFTLRRLTQLGPRAGLVALLETSVMVWLGFAASKLLGFGRYESLFAGGMVAISSTTIILKAFEERKVSGPERDLVSAVLIAEDVLAILLLAILTPVASGHALSAAALTGLVMRFLGFLVVALVAGVLVIPRAMRAVGALHRTETTVVASVGLCFACALLARHFGYSVALGAFLAGALVAESGEAGVVARLVEPVRDLFVAVFFVAVGMLIDPALVLQNLGAILAFTAIVIVGKVTAVSTAAFLGGNGLQTSVRAGMSLAQIGEFSFILAGVAVASGAAGPHLSTIAVAVSALTALLTPVLIASAPAVASWVDRSLPRPIQNFVALYGSWIESARERPAPAAIAARAARAWRILALDVGVLLAITLGALVEGASMAAWVAARFGLTLAVARGVVTVVAVGVGSPFVIGILASSANLGRALAARAFPDPEPGRLDLAAAPRRALIVTIQLAGVAGVGFLLAAVAQPVLPAALPISLLAALLVGIGVRFWRDARNLSGHTRAGAEVIVAALARHTRSAESEAHTLARAYDLVPGLGTPVPVRIESGSPAVGRTIGELEIRGRTGATILAIVRGVDVVLVPDGHERLRAGDVLALAGTEGAVETARAVLHDGSAPPDPGPH